jgi:ABC-2 type transport system permease protein
VSFLWPLVALVRKELIQALRDRRVLFMLTMVPVIQMTIFGYAANIEFNRAETVVVDEDRSPESRSFVEGLAADGTFASRSVASVAEASGELERGAAALAIVLPRGFGADLGAGRRVAVQALVDGSDPSRSIGASAGIDVFCQRRSLEQALARRPVGLAPPVVPHVVIEPRMLYNPALKSRIFMVPGTAASLLLIITTLVTAVGLAREREVGTMEQLLVTPLAPLTLMLGKMLPYAMFGLLDEILLLVVGNLLFDVPLRGPMPVVFLGAALYLVCTLGTGLLISTLVRTQQQALMSGFFFLLPAILLSGMMTPITSMPSWIVPITYVNPVRWFVEIHRSVLLRGSSLVEIARPMLALAALGVALIGVAAARFKKTVG